MPTAMGRRRRGITIFPRLLRLYGKQTDERRTEWQIMQQLAQGWRYRLTPMYEFHWLAGFGLCLRE